MAHLAANLKSAQRAARVCAETPGGGPLGLRLLPAGLNDEGQIGRDSTKSTPLQKCCIFGQIVDLAPRWSARAALVPAGNLLVRLALAADRQGGGVAAGDRASYDK